MRIATTSATSPATPPRDLMVGEPGSPVATSVDPRFALFAAGPDQATADHVAERCREPDDHCREHIGGNATYRESADDQVDDDQRDDRRSKRQQSGQRYRRLTDKHAQGDQLDHEVDAPEQQSCPDDRAGGDRELAQHRRRHDDPDRDPDQCGDEPDPHPDEHSPIVHRGTGKIAVRAWRGAQVSLGR